MRRPSSVAEVLAEREEVGERLARVRAIGEQVDDRDVDGDRHRLERGVVEHARRDHRAVAGERAGDVLDRLAAAEVDLLAAQHDGVAAEAVHRELGGDTRCGPTASRTAARRRARRARPGRSRACASTSRRGRAGRRTAAGVRSSTSRKRRMKRHDCAPPCCDRRTRARRRARGEDADRFVDLGVGHEQRRREAQRRGRDRVEHEPARQALVGDRPWRRGRARARPRAAARVRARRRRRGARPARC